MSEQAKPTLAERQQQIDENLRLIDSAIRRLSGATDSEWLRLQVELCELNLKHARLMLAAYGGLQDGGEVQS